MKKILTIISAALLLAACQDGANEFGRIDQKDPNIPAPQPVLEVTQTPINGGAILKFKIPNDNNIKGVIATYERNGEIINAKSSRYVDTLVVEGFPDSLQRTVSVCTFNVNEEKSEPKTITITPLKPAIRLVTADVVATFGGVKVFVTNNKSKANFAVTILRDEDTTHINRPMKDIPWEEVTTLFTASDSVYLTRRGIDTTRALFGIAIRDHWGNVSDTLAFIRQPWPETKLDQSFVTYVSNAGDNCSSTSSSYPIMGLWDSSGQSAAGYFFASNSGDPMPQWLTFDLHVKAVISRIHTLPRIDYNIWSGAHPRDFEFWGSIDTPTTKRTTEEDKDKAAARHYFEDCWFLLGRFQQYKPSGYASDGTPGAYTAEDRTYFNAGNDFEIDNMQPGCEHAWDEIRYLRIVFLDTFETFENAGPYTPSRSGVTGQVQFGDIMPYGDIKTGKL